MRPEIYGVVTTHIAPARGYGGPAVAVAELVRAWIRSGHSIALCTSDATEGSRLAAADLKIADRVEVFFYRAYWARRWGFGFGAPRYVFSVCRKAKAVYVNGIGTWPTTLAALFCVMLRRRFVVAVRGGLMSEHVTYIHRHKPWKRLFYWAITLPTLQRATAVHCTSESEAQGVRTLLGADCRCVVAGNGVDLHRIVFLAPPIEPIMTLCYVGRISPEKGINEFLRVWSSCRAPRERFIVVGSGEGKYFSEFLDLMRAPDSGIDYRGYVGREGVFGALEESHFLILPSGLGSGGVRENFGNAVAEALGAGRPTIVSRGLSWDRIEKDGAGIVFDRNTEAARTAIERARKISPQAWVRMAKKARAYAKRELDIRVTAKQVMNTLRSGRAVQVATVRGQKRKGQR